jgi:hypothetical protein
LTQASAPEKARTSASASESLKRILNHKVTAMEQMNAVLPGHPLPGSSGGNL